VSSTYPDAQDQQPGDGPDSQISNLPTTLELAAVTLAMQHPLTRTWATDDERLPRLAHEHEDDLDLASNMEMAAFRANYFAFPGLDAPAYLNRWRPVSTDLKALLSIRFEGRVRTRPFVDLSGLSRPWKVTDLPDLKRAALEVYGAFAPLYLRLFSAAPVGALPGLDRDRRFVAAPVLELADLKTSIPPELILRPTQDDRHLAQAGAAYAALDAQHPAHAYQAQILDAEQLQEAVGAGLMFDVLVGQEWAGYVGVHPDEDLGLLSYSVQELLLTPAYRGRGSGAHLTTLLARAILAARPAEPGRVLFGTIHADNAGAYPAALRAGRHDVGGWVQLKL
jgi:GNAT superfamily N-acetyltransferase